MMFVSGIFFLTICLLNDHMMFDWFIYKLCTRSRKLPPQSSDIDDDVQEEVERIENMSEDEMEDKNLVLKGLTKFYGKFLAVNQLYLAVGRSECFGLLGVNGAGKTTTFKMMTGDEIISSGDAFIHGFSTKNQMRKVHELIGYCPQFDALLTDLTGRETMKIFSLLRGILRDEIDELTEKLSHELGFNQHLDKKIEAFSGGNKRKLSTALSLIGDPLLIFLDEPTTGMDPSAKRQLWNIINKTRNSGRCSIVMTSHSMEECETLCTKIAIMVDGEFECLGSPQRLKNKFSKGFVLTVKAGNENEKMLKLIHKQIKQNFPSAELKEKYMDIMTFQVPVMDLVVERSDDAQFSICPGNVQVLT
jgi:ATP-binding cassette, subfamily A (ABC1), member 3